MKRCHAMSWKHNRSGVLFLIVKNSLLINLKKILQCENLNGL